MKHLRNTKKARPQQISNIWPKRPIGELLKKVGKPVKIEDDRSYREIGIRSHCKGIFHKPPILGKQLGSKRVFWIEPGCLVFNIVFAWEHAVALTTEAERGMIASHRFPMYRSADGALLPEFAHLYFSSPRGKYALGIASPGGAGRNKTLGQEEFKSLEILVPAVEHQRLSVEVIRTWSRAIGELSALIEAKRRLRQGLLRELLSPPTDASGWTRHTLGSLGTTFPGLAGKTKADFGSGAPYIPYLNIFGNSRINPKNLGRVRITPGEKQHTVRYGDIFFTTSSETAEEVGMSSVLLDEIGIAYLNSFCFGFRLKSFNRLQPEYARFAFRGPQFRKAIYVLAQGATRHNISKTELMKIAILLPSVTEQRRKALMLDCAEGEIAELNALKAGIQDQQRGLMQRLLKSPGWKKGKP